MKCIELTRGKVAIVDDEDFERLAQWRWRYSAGYAARNDPARRRRVIWMHKEIAGIPRGVEGDHKNGNTLDNRRTNLRPATRSQNAMNAARRKNSTSGFKGVSLYRNGKFRAYIMKDRKELHLGYFETAEAAALAYNAAAVLHHGEFANLN